MQAILQQSYTIWYTRAGLQYYSRKRKSEASPTALLQVPEPGELRSHTMPHFSRETVCLSVVSQVCKCSTQNKLRQRSARAAGMHHRNMST